MESFINSDKLSLYRGEALQTLGDFSLETSIDLDSAFSYYSRCYKWLSEIRKQKAALDSYRVPNKANHVTSPPASEKKLSGWIKSITENPIKPEQIINRLHCTWYLDSLRARNGKMLSLCFFMRGDCDQALKAAKAVIKYEPLERMMYNSKQPNSYSRLAHFNEIRNLMNEEIINEGTDDFTQEHIKNLREMPKPESVYSL